MVKKIHKLIIIIIYQVYIIVDALLLFPRVLIIRKNDIKYLARFFLDIRKHCSNLNLLLMNTDK